MTHLACNCTHVYIDWLAPRASGDGLKSLTINQVTYQHSEGPMPHSLALTLGTLGPSGRACVTIQGLDRPKDCRFMLAKTRRRYLTWCSLSNVGLIVQMIANTVNVLKTEYCR